MVGRLYSVSDETPRDAGFSIFYMGDNIGGFAVGVDHPGYWRKK